MSELETVSQLIDDWYGKANQLQAKHDHIEERQEYPYDGSWDAARERADPLIKKDAVEDCIEDLEECDSIEEALEAFADWRKESDELDKRILDSHEWFRKTMRRLQLEECLEEFQEAVPDDIFEECFSCGGLELPVSDKRRRTGFRWECPECAF